MSFKQGATGIRDELQEKGKLNMESHLKSVARRILPQGVHQTLKNFLNTAPRALHKHDTERVLAMAPVTPAYLDEDSLDLLQGKYAFPPAIGWDVASLDARGKARAAQLLRFQGASEANSFLELGCWDGMVSCHLAKHGKQATAIDRRDIGFDERASRQGVRLMKMNAAHLQFEDECFDYVFSYDSFEHVDSPEEVLSEATRVVKKGGYIYLDFGPLYYSPFGEHAYGSITVPYCQFLFPPTMINEFAEKKGLPLIDFKHVNGWSLESYRNLWAKYSSVLARVKYYEGLELSHMDLIRTYPSCFKSKSDYFENFIVCDIKVLFRKGQI
jgi:ubiquinone/menaquinone biosynthesis C-methylase UbiE